MKIIFNDATELQIQSAIIVGNLLQIKTVSATKEELRAKFSDEFACRMFQIEERGQIIATYENYTQLYRLEEYTGGILGVAMYKVGETPEERLDEIETDVEQTNADLQMAIAELTMLIATMQGGVAGV